MKYFAILVSLCFFLATSAFAITTDAVKRLQSQLNYLGYNAGSVDGQYGKKTENALKEFSAQNGYKIDHFDEVALNVINNHFVDIGYDIYALLLEDDHLKNSELLKAKLPTDPRVIKDYDRFFQYRTERIPYEYSYYENWLWKEQGSDLVAHFKLRGGCFGAIREGRTKHHGLCQPIVVFCTSRLPMST